MKHRFDLWVGKIPWRRAWHPTPASLSGESPQTEEPEGPQSMGSHRVGHDWSDSAHRHAHGALEGTFLTTGPPGKSLKVIIDGKIFSLATYWEGSLPESQFRSTWGPWGLWDHTDFDVYVPTHRFDRHRLLGEPGSFRGFSLPHPSLHVLVRLSTDKVRTGVCG